MSLVDLPSHGEGNGRGLVAQVGGAELASLSRWKCRGGVRCRTTNGGLSHLFNRVIRQPFGPPPLALPSPPSSAQRTWHSQISSPACIRRAPPVPVGLHCAEGCCLSVYPVRQTTSCVSCPNDRLSSEVSQKVICAYLLTWSTYIKACLGERGRESCYKFEDQYWLDLKRASPKPTLPPSDQRCLLSTDRNTSRGGCTHKDRHNRAARRTMHMRARA